MEAPAPKRTPENSPDVKLKIYFLPNLLTAGNLFCGFVALTKIVEARPGAVAGRERNWAQIKYALGFILLACIFDLFDGRVARMGGVESPFGREFDSLADLISFGAAPAFPGASGGAAGCVCGPAGDGMVHRVDLSDLRGVSAGALQLSGGEHGQRRERQGVPGLSHPLGRRPGRLADAVDHVSQRERRQFPAVPGSTSW